MESSVLFGLLYTFNALLCEYCSFPCVREKQKKMGLWKIQTLFENIMLCIGSKQGLSQTISLIPGTICSFSQISLFLASSKSTPSSHSPYAPPPPASPAPYPGGTARTQPIQKPQPVSQNSSAAHSIGSTQSTPCSSSSTA